MGFRPEFPFHPTSWRIVCWSVSTRGIFQGERLNEVRIEAAVQERADDTHGYRFDGCRTRGCTVV